MFLGTWLLEKAKDQRTQESYDFSTLVPVMAPLALFCGPVLCCTVSAVSERQGCSPHRAASIFRDVGLDCDCAVVTSLSCQGSTWATYPSFPSGHLERVPLICWKDEQRYPTLGDDSGFWIARGSKALAYSTGSRLRQDLRSVSTLG